MAVNKFGAAFSIIHQDRVAVHLVQVLPLGTITAIVHRPGLGNHFEDLFGRLFYRHVGRSSTSSCLEATMGRLSGKCDAFLLGPSFLRHIDWLLFGRPP